MLRKHQENTASFSTDVLHEFTTERGTKDQKVAKILETSRSHSPVLTQSPINCYKKFLLSGRAAQTPGEHSQLFNGPPTWVYNRTRYERPKSCKKSRGHSPVLTQSPIYCYKKFLLSGRAAQTPGEHSQLFNGRPTWVYNRTRYKKPKSCKNILRKSNSLLRPPKGVVSHLVRRVSTRNVWIRHQNTTYQYNAGQKTRYTILMRWNF